MVYFSEQDFIPVAKQRKIMLTVFFIVLGVYLIVSAGLMIWYRTLPYQSPTITTVKAIHYSMTGLTVIFAFIFLGISFKRVNKFYKLCKNLITGIKEESTANFFEYDETVMQKDGVDFKSLIFLEWNKYKKDYFERKVLVFNEKPFPEMPENATVHFITQGNVLISYEIEESEPESQEETQENGAKWYKDETDENKDETKSNDEKTDEKTEGDNNESDSDGNR